MPFYRFLLGGFTVVVSVNRLLLTKELHLGLFIRYSRIVGDRWFFKLFPAIHFLLGARVLVYRFSVGFTINHKKRK
jgi:hypothetical protein